MATTAMDYESANNDRFEDDGARYERDPRSASPRASRGDDVEGSRRRSASPNGNGSRAMKEDNGSKGGDDDGAVNPGSNLFVTGIHPKLSEEEVTRLFEKYGEVEKCQIMRDPHTKDSRGFGFVKMVTSDQADAAKDGLQGEVIEGRTLSIEKARRARPRTPTPGKYFGPPKREGGGRGGRFDDRRRGGGYGGGYGGGRDDSYRYRGYRDDRGYDRGYRDDRGYGREERGYREDRSYGREDRGYRGGEDRGGYSDRRDRDEGYGRVDRYASGGGGASGGSGGGGGGGGGGGREDRDRGYDRRGPGYERERYDRGDREAPRSREAAPSGYGEAPARTDARDNYAGAP